MAANSRRHGAAWTQRAHARRCASTSHRGAPAPRAGTSARRPVARAARPLMSTGSQHGVLHFRNTPRALLRTVARFGCWSRKHAHVIPRAYDSRAEKTNRCRSCRRPREGDDRWCPLFDTSPRAARDRNGSILSVAAKQPAAASALSRSALMNQLRPKIRLVYSALEHDVSFRAAVVARRRAESAYLR